MSKNTYFVIVVSENGKKLAYATTINNSNNLVSALKVKGIQSANVADTKKEAEEIARIWNECYKKNGCYMFA